MAQFEFSEPDLPDERPAGEVDTPGVGLHLPAGESHYDDSLVVQEPYNDGVVDNADPSDTKEWTPNRSFMRPFLGTPLEISDKDRSAAIQSFDDGILDSFARDAELVDKAPTSEGYSILRLTLHTEDWSQIVNLHRVSSPSNTVAQSIVSIEDSTAEHRSVHSYKVLDPVLYDGCREPTGAVTRFDVGDLDAAHEAAIIDLQQPYGQTDQETEPVSETSPLTLDLVDGQEVAGLFAHIKSGRDQGKLLPISQDDLLRHLGFDI